MPDVIPTAVAIELGVIIFAIGVFFVGIRSQLQKLTESIQHLDKSITDFTTQNSKEHDKLMSQWSTAGQKIVESFEKLHSHMRQNAKEHAEEHKDLSEKLLKLEYEKRGSGK